MSVSKFVLFRDLEKIIKKQEKKYEGLFNAVFEIRERLKDLIFFSEFYPRYQNWIDRHESLLNAYKKNTYLPMIICEQALVAYSETLKKNSEYYFDTRIFAGLSAWALTKGIYQFDSNLEAELSNTPMVDTLQIECFKNLPEFCVYVKTKDTSIFCQDVDGFFCYINEHHPFDDERNVFKLHFLFRMKKTNGLFPIEITVDGKEKVMDSVAESLSTPFYTWINDLESSTEEEKEVMYNNYSISQGLIKHDSNTVNSAISLVLYLCSQKPEYSGLKPSFPTPVKTKKGLRFFPPDKPKIIEIGKSIGEKLRQYEAAQEKEYIESGRTLRPHIRRGHWHGVWTGARNSETPQTFKYNWLPPMGVNIEGGI